jgi:hypothetical protein
MHERVPPPPSNNCLSQWPSGKWWTKTFHLEIPMNHNFLNRHISLSINAEIWSYLLLALICICTSRMILNPSHYPTTTLVYTFKKDHDNICSKETNPKTNYLFLIWNFNWRCVLFFILFFWYIMNVAIL